MAIAIVYTRANLGVGAPLVTVEAHLSNGLPGFAIVGLPETAVKESKERVRSAIINSQLDFPDRRITINLAPADLPKSGGRFDLAIAVGILAASRQLETDGLAGLEFLGELALSGEVREVVGVLPGIVACKNEGRISIIPQANSGEASLVKGIEVRTCKHLLDVCGHLQGRQLLPQALYQVQESITYPYDLADVVGQYQAKRALMIAAAGGHNLLMQGPPGTGKTMLASRISTILPALDDTQALETAVIKSISKNTMISEGWHIPPFRAPHHTSSAVALVGGGGNKVNVGEISLAHNGVLFLDEIPEFSPKVLEVMREPMESGSILISRASYQVRMPARFQLIASMNPCPCGYHGDSQEECRCTAEKIKQYQSRISGPLLDRIDLHVDVPRLNDNDRKHLLSMDTSINRISSEVRASVIQCRALQISRSGVVNAQLSHGQINQFCNLSKSDKALLENTMTRLKLSTRAYFRILKIARTIADFNEAEKIQRDHLMEAINYRKFDRRL